MSDKRKNFTQGESISFTMGGRGPQTQPILPFHVELD